jgi:hypothetical protein
MYLRDRRPGEVSATGPQKIQGPPPTRGCALGWGGEQAASILAEAGERAKHVDGGALLDLDDAELDREQAARGAVRARVEHQQRRARKRLRKAARRVQHREQRGRVREPVCVVK